MLKEKDNFVKVDKKQKILLEQETAVSILEKKKIDLRKPYYEENNISETLTEIENEKQKNIGDYLKLGLNILQRILIRLET